MTSRSDTWSVRNYLREGFLETSPGAIFRTYRQESICQYDGPSRTLDELLASSGAPPSSSSSSASSSAVEYTEEFLNSSPDSTSINRFGFLGGGVGRSPLNSTAPGSRGVTGPLASPGYIPESSGSWLPTLSCATCPGTYGTLLVGIEPELVLLWLWLCPRCPGHALGMADGPGVDGGVPVGAGAYPSLLLGNPTAACGSNAGTAYAANGSASSCRVEGPGALGSSKYPEGGLPVWLGREPPYAESAEPCR